MSVNKEESIISHIDDFRSMLLKCIKAIVIVMFPLFFVAPTALNLFVKLILRGNNISLNYFSPAEVFLIQIKFSVVLAIIISFPYMAKQVWNFCVPALYENERKFIKSIVFTSSFLFVLGSLFCLFVILPFIINFGMSFSSPNIHAVFGISNVINLSLWLIFSFGIMFQLPLITYSLINSELVSYKTIKGCRPYVVVVILVIAGVLTPPDIVSQLMLFVPTYLLFEFGLLLAKNKKCEKENINEENV